MNGHWFKTCWLWFFIQFAGEGDLYIRSVRPPQNHVKCGEQFRHRTVVSCAFVIFITLFVFSFTHAALYHPTRGQQQSSLPLALWPQRPLSRLPTTSSSKHTPSTHCHSCSPLVTSSHLETSFFPFPPWEGSSPFSSTKPKPPWFPNPAQSPACHLWITLNSCQLFHSLWVESFISLGLGALPGKMKRWPAWSPRSLQALNHLGYWHSS